MFSLLSETRTQSVHAWVSSAINRDGADVDAMYRYHKVLDRQSAWVACHHGMMEVAAGSVRAQNVGVDGRPDAHRKCTYTLTEPCQHYSQKVLCAAAKAFADRTSQAYQRMPCARGPGPRQSHVRSQSSVVLPQMMAKDAPSCRRTTHSSWR